MLVRMSSQGEAMPRQYETTMAHLLNRRSVHQSIARSDNRKRQPLVVKS